MSDTKLDVYERVTNKIIADLERGNLTWFEPWQAGHQAGPVSRPLRAVGKPYQGINVIMLWVAAMEKNYGNPIWLTYKQAQELGGQVRKGETSSPVVYANAFKKTETNEQGEDVEREIPFLKQYSVFNAEQVDGLPDPFYAKIEPPNNDIKRLEDAEQFFLNTKINIQYGGPSAFYRLDRDIVHIPERQTFRDTESLYATISHELTHATRHPTRLARDLGRKHMGDAGYAREELVAEIGAAFLCADLQITAHPREDHAAYIESWLTVLRNDKKAIFSAASHAQKAVDYLHGLQPS